jgi:hypothetical protein
MIQGLILYFGYTNFCIMESKSDKELFCIFESSTIIENEKTVHNFRRKDTAGKSDGGFHGRFANTT